MSQDQISIDPSAVEFRLRMKRPGSQMWWRRLLESVAIAALLFYALAVGPDALESGDVRTLISPPSRELWRVLAVVFAAVGLPLFISSFRYTRDVRRGSIEVARNMERDWKRATQPGWEGRTVLRGIMLGLGIGVPVGLLMALGLPLSELPGGSRLGMFFTFTLMTLTWTIPAAFVIRWRLLRDYRRLQSSPNAE